MTTFTALYFHALFAFYTYVYGESFNPSVHCTCHDGRMMITIHTDTPFDGIVYTEGHRSDCYWLGKGEQEMSVSLALGGTDCGLHYNQIDEDYRIILYVRQHPTVLLEQDRAFNLTCHSRNSKAVAQTISEVINVKLEVLTNDNDKVHETVFGREYRLRVQGSGDAAFLVGPCTAFAGRYSAKLIDQYGCSMDVSIITDFEYMENGFTVQAILPSIFRFPSTRYVHFQCNVTMCSSGSCHEADHEDQSNESSSHDPQLQHTVSTTVTVLDIGGSLDVRYGAPCSDEYSILSQICIFVGLLFVLTITLHTALCLFYGYGHCHKDDPKYPPAKPCSHSRQSEDNFSPCNPRNDQSIFVP